MNGVDKAILALAAGSAVSLALGDALPLGLGALIASCLVLKALSVETFGSFGGLDERMRGIDPKVVLEYRREHPGATIADALRVLSR